MTQDTIFEQGEGDAWFQRNRQSLTTASRPDWPLQLIDMLQLAPAPTSIIELGCANGWRLARLQQTHAAQMTGIDASAEAIADGNRQFPGIRLLQGSLAALPVTTTFNIVIVNFVLHWIDRSKLARCVAEIDRVTADGGILILGDFLPDYPQRQIYHHLPDANVYTYKQDYAALFSAFGTYQELARLTFNHDQNHHHHHSTKDETQAKAGISPCQSTQRGACVALHKSLTGFYHDNCRDSAS
jgi:SAM-dependent methyltransferase